MSAVFIISAPSGSGKSTLVGELLRGDPRLLFSISYTTRLARGAEVAGQNYLYVSREEFIERAGRDEFLEWAEVFGNFYGTHRSCWDRCVAENRDLLLDIDVQGARQLKEKIPDAVTIFILPPSRDVLAQRLRARSEDPEEVIGRRLREAEEEIRNYRRYEYVVVNREVATSVAALGAIVAAERVRRSRMEESIRPILESFEGGVTPA